ncbi:MAG: hypothetical protein EPN30_11125 [Actinomycetota bacterium]|nr:MAG: hypothetical protein EPN30_11125 [Actinomycetota bacterium]
MLIALEILWTVPALAIVISFFRGGRARHEYVNLLSAAAVFGASLTLLIIAPARPRVVAWGYIIISPFGNWVVFCAGTVYLLTSIYSIGYMRILNLTANQASRFYGLLEGFALSMLVAPCMNNPGLYWIVIDLTTIISAFLVGFEREAESIEASWKYLIIVSSGLSLSLLGIVLFYWGGTFHLGPVYSMTWAALHSVAGKVPPSLLLTSFLLVLIGFGTKAGLAPMHTWLPDAHSEGPAPVSAMLSGALLNTAVLGIVRFLHILDGTKASVPAHLAVVIIGVFSLLIAAMFIVRQQGIKRLMAYSSIEHIGIITIGFGFGGILGTAGAMYQMLNHSLNKSLMFFGAGNAMRSYKSKEIDKIRRVLSYYPVTGTLWLLGAIAITGAPPFGLFQSEVAILRAGITSTNSWSVWLIAVLLIVIFVSFMNHFRSMYFGLEPEANGLPTMQFSCWLEVPMWLSLTAILVLGLWWPSGLLHFFIEAGKSL